MDQSLSPAGKPSINVGDTERILSAVGGSLLLYFVTKKHKVDSLLLLGGGYLLYRAVSGHCPVYSTLQERKAAGPSNINIRTHVIVNRPKEEVYALWRNLENLPLFMKHLENVDVIDNTTSAWKLKMPAGLGDIRWEAKIVKEEYGVELSWHSVPGASIENTGKINFSSTPGNATRIDVMLSYRAPMGVVGERISRLFTPAFQKKVEEDIHNFKYHVENADLSGNA
jgi:uncharacterized membrane protein